MIPKLLIRSLMVLLLVPQWVQASPETATQWLQKMMEAQKTVNYQGTFVYSHGDQLESIQVTHSVGEHGVRERLMHLNGSAREVIRNNDMVMCIFPEDKTVMISDRKEHLMAPLVEVADLGFFEKHYTLQLAESNRIAGVTAQQINLIPKDQYRYGYRFWISEQGLLLRSDLLNEEQKVVEHIMFTDVKLMDKIPHDHLTPSRDVQEFTWYRQDSKQAQIEGQKLNWRLNRMPSGFTVKLHHLRKSEEGGNTVTEHMLITDGMASVSVFIEEVSKKVSDKLGLYQMGALNVYTSMLNGHLLVVVGDVPAATVEMIAGGLEVAR